MRSSLELRRASLVLASLTILAGCATATRRAAVNSAVPIARSGDAGQLTLPRDALARAQSAYDAGDYPAAGALFEAIVVQDPSPASIAVFRLATLRSWDNQFDEAIGLYRRYIVLEPRDAEGRLALARTLGWQGQYASAIAIYDSLIASKQRSRDAVIGRAQTLAWSGRLTESLAVEYARALAWNGQYDEAESTYTRLAVTGNAAARKGLARVIGWRGELDRSEQTWRKVLETDPRDPEALTGLAQVLTWQGRQTDAESALQLALRANPAYGDARTLLRWVQADLRPSAIVSAVSINDSDHNRATVLSVDYLARAWWNGAIGGRYTDRSANFAAIDSRADAVNLFARWQPGTSSWQIRAGRRIRNARSAAARFA